MQNKKVVILIPGLGGEGSIQKSYAISQRWQDEQTEVILFDSRWHTSENAASKQRRLTDLYRLHRDKNVSLVSYSAGGSLGLWLLSEESDIQQLITISGKLLGSEKIGPKYQKQAPALIDCVRASESAAKRLTSEQVEKTTNFVPLLDEVVEKRDMVVHGAHKRRVPFVSHVASIGFALLFQVKRALI